MNSWREIVLVSVQIGLQSFKCEGGGKHLFRFNTNTTVRTF